MLTRIWTGFLLSGLCASLVALVVVYMHEKGVYPFRDAWSRLGRQPWGRRIAIAAFVVGMWVYASVKPGDISPERSEHCEAMSLEGCGSGGDGGGDGGGTNNIQMVIGPGGLPQSGSPGAVTNTLDHGVVGEIRPIAGGVLGDPAPVVDEWSDFTPITSTNTTRTLTGEDFRRGFVMTQIETGEEHDFSAPPDATIVSDWQAFGAATDWIYVALTNWAFSVATNDVERLRVYSFGKIEPLIREEGNAIATNYWFAPFMASLGVVPEANWSLLNESARPSRVWYCVTHRNTFVVTWENVLLDRDAGSPISFQVEFCPDGRFVYRYDFSRIDAEMVEDVLAGASFSGNTWITNSLPTNVTSMAFCPLAGDDAYNQDSDSDGIATIDELFVHYTDPHNADSDSDGLSDYEELFVYNTNPLNSYSVSDAYCDAVAVRIGGLDPFSFPEGSTNTVLEHIFYSGTTNGVFAYPQSSAEVAVLKVMVSGSGSGRLVVGDAVVPLVAPPQMRSGAVTNTLLLAVGRGVRREVWFDKPDDLDVALASDDFLIGEMPTWYWAHGWLAFPHTDATVPCIHDLYAKARTVTLVHGEEFAGLAATWKSEDQGVAITNVPPVSAEIHGSFPKNQTRTICYTMSHPDYMAGETNYVQTLRFCPRPADDDLQGDGMAIDEEYGDEHYCSCNLGVCCSNPWCDCGCACCEVENGEVPANICIEHNCPYDQCESLHRDAYTNATAVASMADVLKLDRVPVHTNTISIDVPDAWVKCCDCPDHWTNYVALAAKSYNLAVRTEDGERFERTVDDCNVYVHGLAPSRDFEDSILSLCKTGVVYETHRYTVLGLDIGHPRCAAHEVVGWNSNFGFPVAATTNVNLATEMYLKTDVDLPSGEINVRFDNPTVRFQLYLGGEYDERTLLLDTDVHEEGRTISLEVWKRLTRELTSDRKTRITVVAFGAGTATLRYSFAAIHSSRSVTDMRELRLTAVLPLLVPDVDGNGTMNADDARLCVSNRFNFWVNNDIWTGNDAFDDTFWDWIDGLGNDDNGDDNEVNGRNDLVNLLPMAVRVQDFLSAWSSHEVKIVIRGRYSGVRRLYADIAWNDARASVLRDIEVDDESSWYNFWSGTTLHSASFPSLGESERPLADNVAARSQSDRGVVLFEAEWECECPIEVAVKVDGNEVFACRPDLAFLDVKKMYWWHNLRHLFGGQGKIDPSDTNMTSVAQLPLSAFRQDANFYFVHGYNMAQHEAREWAQATYKRLWWAGFRGRFHAVTWYSNDSQFKAPLVGYVCPNYQANVEHAFASASNLTAVVANYTGPNYFMAHSLGNMLVSAAIQDWQMPCARYFMLNAAVAAEAYDPSTNAVNAVTIDRMLPREWVGYDALLKAAHWSELFDVGDGRRKLTWKGRFSNVNNVVNYYSSEEEVLKCGYGESHSTMQREWAWYNQERIKGVKPFEMGLGRNEGGWEFNTAHFIEDTYYDDDLGEDVTYFRKRSATEANALLSGGTADFKSTPFFGWFEDRTICTNTFLAESTISPQLRAQLLADAIPAESLPAGLAPVPKWESDPFAENQDMATSFKGQMTTNILGSASAQWRHSFFLSAPYMVVHGLFEDVNAKTQQGGVQ